MPFSRAPARGSRWLALVVLCVGILMIILDQTIVNVALPAIQSDLGFSQASLAWVVNAYLVPFGGLLLLAGRVGDLIGRKRIFLSGLAVFSLASLLCGLAGSQEMLLAARFLQGAGGAMTSSVILGMIVTLFPQPAEQARALGVYSFVASAGGAIGLLAGGMLTHTAGWHWIFLVNVPIGLATALAATRLIQRDHGIGFGQGADLPGAFLLVGGLMLAVYTIVEMGNQGRVGLERLGLAALALALLAVFALREARTPHPLVPLGIFRSRTVVAANLIQALMMAGLFGQLFLGTLYLQRVLRFGTLEVGLGFLPVAVAIGALSLGFAPRLIRYWGARATLLPGLASITVGLALLARTPAAGDYLRDMLPALLLLGVGGGLCFPALAALTMSGATERDAGLAAGLANTSQQVGGALGLAVLATLATIHTDSLLAAGEGLAPALTRGYNLAFGVGAGFAAATVLLAMLGLRPPAVEGEPRVADAEALEARRGDTG